MPTLHVPTLTQLAWTTVGNCFVLDYAAIVICYHYRCVVCRRWFLFPHGPSLRFKIQHEASMASPALNS